MTEVDPTAGARGVVPRQVVGTRGLLIAAWLVAAVMILGRLGTLPLINPDEGRNAEVAREMASAGHWLIPTYNQAVYLDKPAAFFDTVALSLRLFGNNEAAARLPSACFALGLLLMLFRFCRRVYGVRDAALAVAVVATMPLFFAFGRMVIFDMMLAFFVCAAVLSAYRAEEATGRPRRLWYLAGAAAAAAATLVKGPVGFLVPGLVVLVWGLVEGRRGGAFRFLAPLNLVVFLALVLPWFFAVLHRQPDFAYYGLVEESFHRFTTGSFHRTAPVYYYGPVILGAAFAWSMLLPESVVVAWRARRRWQPADRLFITWALVVVAFFSLSQSKLPGYVLTAVIALGVLTARVFGFAWDRPEGRAAAVVRRGVLILGVFSAAAAAFLIPDVIAPGTLQRVFHIRGREFIELVPAFPPVMVALLITALTAFLSLRWRNPALAFGAFFVFPALLLTLAFPGFQSYAEVRSARPLARAIAAQDPGISLACLECYPDGLAFYLKRPVTLISRDGGELKSNYVLFRIRRGNPWPTTIVPLADGQQWLDARAHPRLLLAGSRHHAGLDSLAATRGSTARQLVPGWWGALLSAGEQR